MAIVIAYSIKRRCDLGNLFLNALASIFFGTLVCIALPAKTIDVTENHTVYLMSNGSVNYLPCKDDYTCITYVKDKEFAIADIENDRITTDQTKGYSYTSITSRMVDSSHWWNKYFAYDFPKIIKCRLYIPENTIKINYYYTPTK